MDFFTNVNMNWKSVLLPAPHPLPQQKITEIFSDMISFKNVSKMLVLFSKTKNLCLHESDIFQSLKMQLPLQNNRKLD